MPWVRLDDHFDEHPKLAAVGPLGVALWAAGLAYCNRNLTDGLIPGNVARRLILTDGLYDADGRELRTRDIVVLLVERGLWEQDGEDYRVHDYLEYQSSRQKIIHDREQARIRMQQGRKNSGSSSEVRANSDGSSDAPTPTPTPTPGPKGERAAPARRQRRERAPAPPAVEVFRETMHRYPDRAQYDAIAEAVGADDDRLALWRSITEAWRDRGWNRGNLAGMLDCFRRGEVPGTNRPRGRDSPPAWDPTVAPNPDGIRLEV